MKNVKWTWKMINEHEKWEMENEKWKNIKCKTKNDKCKQEVKTNN